MPAGLRYGVEVRAAAAPDAPELARLLGMAGLPTTPGEAARRLDALRAAPGTALLVATGYAGLIGLAALHWSPVLHRAAPVARLTALLVDAEERRHGIARLLLKAAAQAARTAGCDTLELTAGDAEGALAAFCHATGFAQEGPVFTRALRRQMG